QEDEGEDPGHVDGGESFRRHHRLPASCSDDARLHHQPAIHRTALDHPDRTYADGRQWDVDDDGLPRHAQDDQFRFLTRGPCCRFIIIGWNVWSTGWNTWATLAFWRCCSLRSARWPPSLPWPCRCSPPIHSAGA